MAYVLGCDHDVFVSYAHLDNIPIREGHAGWVDTLVEQLRNEVTKRVGTREFQIWMDHNLDGNRPITAEILNAIRRSATLLVVMSPGYLNSEWCRREREAFLSVVRDRVAQGSVFVVFARDVNRAGIPPEFGDLIGVQFWAQDNDAGTDRLLGVPDPLEPTYISRVLRLSHDLKKQLDHLRKSADRDANPRSQPPPAQDGPCVFVARATEDLEDREEELKAYLSQANIEILPQTWYPQSDREALESAMRRDLQRCKAFVQLLSTSRGREIECAPTKRPPRFQYEIAAAAGIPILQWRDRDIDLDAVRDPEHRALLDGARACGLEEFKRAVLDEASRVPVAPRPAPKHVMVFVNADPSDRQLAESVGRALVENQVECYWPLTSGTPDCIRRDLEENLSICDGVLLIYGATGADWIRSQLRQGRKIISQRERPLTALAIYEGPPEKKEDLAVGIPDLLKLDCRNGVAAEALKPFIDSLRR